MRKLTKALAAVLLIAVVVSVMAVLPTFTASAEEAEAAEEVTYGTYVYQQGTNNAPTISNKVANANGTKVPTSSTNTVDGVKYWTFSWEDTPAGANPAPQNFWQGLANTNAIRVRDDSTYGEKNVNYFVIDLDVSTDTVFPNQVFFNTRLYGSGASSSLGNSNGSEYAAFGMDPDGRLYIGNANGANKRYEVVKSDEKWRHITIVYDFHPVTTTTTDAETGEVTTTTTITNNAYAYIDGYYVGTINPLDVNTARIYFIRVQQDDALQADGVSYNLANYSLKTFEAGYDGPMSDAGLLGSGVPLWEIPDLKYTMENAIATPEGYGNEKIADILRGEETIEVFDVDDLNGKLLDGDTVKVYKDVAALKATYVIKNLEGDVAANVQWIDENGVELGADGSLFAAPTVLAVKYDSVWAIVRGGEIYNEGGASYYEGSGSTAIISDPLWANLPATGDNEVILFGDYTLLGRSYGIEGSTSSASSGNEITSGTTTFELNGHTLTSAGKRTHLIVVKSSTLVMTFKNGAVNHVGGGNNLVMMSTGDAPRTVFDNCNVTSTGTIIDQRVGSVYYLNSNVTLQGVTLSSAKAVGDEGSAVIVSGCTINSTSGSIVSLAQTNSSGVGRYGSATLGAMFYNTTVTGGAALVGGDIYANASGHTADEYKANLVNHYIAIDGCTVNTGSANLISTDIMSLPTSGENVLTARVAVELRDSTISANSLAYAYRRTNRAEFVDYLETVKVKNCDITVNELSAGFAEQPTVHAEVDFTFDAECRFNKMPVYSAINTVAVALPEGCVLAYTSNTTGYEALVTASYKAYDYQIGDAEPVVFYWNVPAEGKDKVDPNKVAKPGGGVDGIYKYVWDDVDSDSFKAIIRKTYTLSPKANLTLTDYIDFNLYIPVAEYDVECLTFVVTDRAGNVIERDAETITVNEVECYKFQAKNISATAADENALNVAVTINGTYGDTLTNNYGIGILGYAEDILNKSTDEKSIALIQALLNYIVGACAYEADPATAAAAGALIDGVEFGTIAGEAKADALEGVEVAIKYGDRLYVGIKSAAGEQIKISYTVDNQPIEYYATPDESGEIFVYVKAYDFVNDITVTKGGESATFNIQGYYNILGERGETEAQAMVEAIYLYAKAAADYKAAN